MSNASKRKEERQTKLFSDTGTFFAFSNKQLEERQQKDVIYVNMGMGMITPKDNAEKLVEGLIEIQENFYKEHKEEESIPVIIEKELSNQEAYYTNDLDSTVEVLEGYGITREQVVEVYYHTREKHWEED